MRGERASWSIAQGMVSRAIDETHSREDNCMRSSMTTFCFLSVHVLSCVCGMTVQAQSLKVLVLDASDGKPQANPFENPQEFLEGMPSSYIGTYFWAEVAL